MNLRLFTLTRFRNPFGAIAPENDHLRQVAGFVRQLQSAETIRDIYAVPFPHSLVAVPPGSIHGNAGSTIDASLKRSGKFRASIYERGYLKEGFGKAGRITAAFNQMVSKNQWQTSIKCTTRDIGSGNALHFDFPEATPLGIVQITTSDQGTNVLPHDRTLDILQRSRLAPLLDVRLDSPLLKSHLDWYYRFLRGSDDRESRRIIGAIKEAMLPLPTDTMNLWTGITIHQKPEIEAPFRTTYKAVTHFGMPVAQS